MDEVKVFDHGYVKFIESWGSDERIIESARMSTDGAFRGWGGKPCPKCLLEGRLSDVDHLYRSYADSVIGKDCICCKGTGKTIGDEQLLKYLWEHKHSTPFEFAGMTVEIQAPIVVFREWHRHRTQSYSELSARYTPLPDMNYMPTVDRCLIVNGKNRQAGKMKGADELTHASVLAWLEELSNVYAQAERVYQIGLNCGIPKEVARLSVPVGRYSRMRASTDLLNWLKFLTLRMDDTAQYEIRQYANVVGQIIAEQFPRTWTLFRS